MSVYVRICTYMYVYAHTLCMLFQIMWSKHQDVAGHCTVIKCLCLGECVCSYVCICTYMYVYTHTLCTLFQIMWSNHQDVAGHCTVVKCLCLGGCICSYVCICTYMYIYVCIRTYSMHALSNHVVKSSRCCRTLHCCKVPVCGWVYM